MPQGDDFTVDVPLTPAPVPVDASSTAAAAPVVVDPAVPAPAAPTPAPATPAPDETPDAAAQRRRDAAFAAQRRENQALKARLDALEARQTPAPVPDPTPPAPVAGATPPQPEAFPTHAAYVQAVAQWTVTQHEALKEATTTATQIQTAWAQQEQQAKTKFADYDAALEADTTRYHPAVLQALQTSDQGAEVAYHLATHPEDAQRIAALAPAAALRALGRLEATLEAQTASTASGAAHEGGPPHGHERQPSAGPAQQPTPTPTPTPLPTPLAPVGGAGPGGSSVSPDQLPYEEYVAWYKKTFGSR